MSSQKIIIPAVDDLHVHLRQDDLMNMVVPLIRAGGAKRVLVMPNLKPSINTVAQALEYKKQLQQIDNEVEYLMTLYLNPSLTVEEVRLASESGIIGIKSYPRGVTTNSESGIENYEIYYPIFAEMEKLGLILNIHGEVPSNHKQNICIWNAEEKFLEHLEKLHKAFPKLRIVLEHVTTKAAVDKVKELGGTVVATITIHHLELTIDDWAGKNHNFCKPVAKSPIDREALREVVKEGNHKFFLGSDSAPHTIDTKETACACAGVFTTPLLMPYLAHIFEDLACLDKLQDFTSTFGSDFYKIPKIKETICLEKVSQTVPVSYQSVVPYRANEEIRWTVNSSNK
jgi:dihydroorotase